MKAKLLYYTPLWVLEHSGRQSHNSLDRFVKDDELNTKWLKKHVDHTAMLKKGHLLFQLRMPRTVLLELEKHIVGVCSPTDVSSSINRSTRYTLKTLLNLLKHAEAEQTPDPFIEYIQENCYFLNDADRRELPTLIGQTLWKAWRNGADTPDLLKCYLPENWLTQGDWCLSFLAFRNILAQRWRGKTGKPHFLIKEIVGEMLAQLPDHVREVLVYGL